MGGNLRVGAAGGWSCHLLSVPPVPWPVSLSELPPAHNCILYIYFKMKKSKLCIFYILYIHVDICLIWSGEGGLVLWRADGEEDALGQAGLESWLHRVHHNHNSLGVPLCLSYE